MTRGMIRFVSYRNLSQKRLLSEQQGRLWSLSDWTWHFVMPYLSKQRVARWYSWYGLLITSFQYMSHCIFHIFWRNLVLATLANNKEHSCVVHLLIREAPFLKCVVSIYGHCPNSFWPPPSLWDGHRGAFFGPFFIFSSAFWHCRYFQVDHLSKIWHYYLFLTKSLDY